jgi:hypothetical protein
VKIDELTFEVLRLDVMKSELEGAITDLQTKLVRAARDESELSARASWLQGIVDEQKGLIAGYKAEVADLSQNLSIVETERNSSREELEDAQKLLLFVESDKILALEKELTYLCERASTTTDLSQRHLLKHCDESEKAKRCKHQLGQVYKVRNRTWIYGFEWGFETFHAVAMNKGLRDWVPTIAIHDIEPDPTALSELKMIGLEKLPDARGLWVVPISMEAPPKEATDEAEATPSGDGGIPPS